MIKNQEFFFFLVVVFTGLTAACGPRDKRGFPSPSAELAKVSLDCGNQPCLPQAGLVYGRIGSHTWSCTGYVVEDGRSRVVDVPSSCLESLATAQISCQGHVAFKLPQVSRVFQCRQYRSGRPGRSLIQFAPALPVTPLPATANVLNPEVNQPELAYQIENGRALLRPLSPVEVTEASIPQDLISPPKTAPDPKQSAITELQVLLEDGARSLTARTVFQWHPKFINLGSKLGEVVTFVPICLKQEARSSWWEKMQLQYFFGYEQVEIPAWRVVKNADRTYSVVGLDNLNVQVEFEDWWVSLHTKGLNSQRAGGGWYGDFLRRCR